MKNKKLLLTLGIMMLCSAPVYGAEAAADLPLDDVKKDETPVEPKAACPKPRPRPKPIPRPCPKPVPMGQPAAKRRRTNLHTVTSAVTAKEAIITPQERIALHNLFLKKYKVPWSHPEGYNINPFVSVGYYEGDKYYPQVSEIRK